MTLEQLKKQQVIELNRLNKAFEQIKKRQEKQYHKMLKNIYLKSERNFEEIINNLANRNSGQITITNVKL